MLSEKRVAHMTKMAMLEDRYGRKLSPTLRYRKRDYLDMCTLGGVFLGTLIYIALYAGGILFVISTVVVNLHLVSTILFILLGLCFIFYICIITCAWCVAMRRSGTKKVRCWRADCARIIMSCMRCTKKKTCQKYLRDGTRMTFFIQLRTKIRHFIITREEWVVRLLRFAIMLAVLLVMNRCFGYQKILNHWWVSVGLQALVYCFRWQGLLFLSFLWG